MCLRTECADVSRVSYILRLAGDALETSDLAALTRVQRDGVGVTLCGDVGDHAWQQATTANKIGGLGLRESQDLAFPAFISSRVASRSAAARVFDDYERAGLAPI